MSRISKRAAAVALLMSVAAPTLGEELELRTRGVEGSELVVDVVASELREVGSLELTVGFEPSQLGPPRLERGSLTGGGMIADNLVARDRYKIAVISPLGVTGEGDVATLRFPIRDSEAVSTLGLEASLTDLSGSLIRSSARGVSASLGGSVEEAEPPPDPERDPARDDAEPADPTRESDGETSATRDVREAERGASEQDRQRPADEELLRSVLERERETRDRQEVRDNAARLAGYKMVMRFEPEEMLATAGSTPIRARLYAFRHARMLPLEPRQVSLTGRGVEVVRVTAADDGLELELRVDGEALPGRLEVRGLGLHAEFLVPVYPQVDVDFDDSGDLTLADYQVLGRSLGAQDGEPLYEERLDIVRDGTIDNADFAAFQFILVETERARRLRSGALVDSEGSVER